MVLWVGETQNLRIRIRFFHAKKHITIIKRWRLRSSYLFSHQCKSVSKTRKKAFFNIVNWIYASTANSYFCLQTAQYWSFHNNSDPIRQKTTSSLPMRSAFRMTQQPVWLAFVLRTHAAVCKGGRWALPPPKVYHSNQYFSLFSCDHPTQEVQCNQGN